MLCHQNVHVISANLRDRASVLNRKCHFRVWHFLKFAGYDDENWWILGTGNRGPPRAQIPLISALL